MIYEAEILCLGNELLIGRTPNTNAGFLAKHITQLGFKVTRITTIRDEEEIGKLTIQEILGRRPQVLLITGGLGPTHDDIQLSILSLALNRPLERNQEAYEMFIKKYKEMNPAREKMIELPHGSHPLKNSEGAAPGVMTTTDNTTIFSMPGVPREMMAIFSEEIVPRVMEKYEFDEETYEFGVDLRGVGESGILEITDKIMKEYPDISFKSHPKKDEEGYYMSLHTYAISKNRDRVEEALRKWVVEIEKHYTINKMTAIRSVIEI